MKFFLLLLISGFTFSQNQISGIVVDESTKMPVPSTSISNDSDYTVSNEDGYFLFNSALDSLKISKLGYEEINSTFKELDVDTIYLSPKGMILLDEATIINFPDLMKNAYQNVPKNYPLNPFVEKFFLTTILKRNKEIYRFEDTYGKIKRSSLFLTSNDKKLNFDFQILNQRKAGLRDNIKNIEDFEFHTLKELFHWFSTVFIDLKSFKFNYESIDENHVKVSFVPFEEFKNKNVGYYIIDKRDNSIKEYFSKTNPEFQKDISFTEKQGIKFRTVKAELFVRFAKNQSIDNYFMSDVTLNQTIEVFRKNSEKVEYDVAYQLVNVKSFDDDVFKSNIRDSKRIFEIDFKYNELFWQNQNQLLLTEDLKSFIKSSATDSKEFKVISNF